MTELQNPFVFAASDAAAEQAAAPLLSQAPSGAAADLSVSPSAIDCSLPDTGESDPSVMLDCPLGENHIGEIFVGARRLDALDAEYLFELDPGNQKYRGMPKPRLDVAAFMLELDEPPLFLRQAG